MRVVVCYQFGPVDQLVVEDQQPAALQPGQARVAVKAAGVGFVHGLMVQGLYQIKPALPFRPGGEIAGVVTEVADAANEHLVGQRVISLAMLAGGWSDEVVASANRLIPIPDTLTNGQAATFMESYMTGWFTFKKRVPVEPGECLLVLGAGSGVGLAAVDIGHALGLTVIAAASSPEKRAAAVAAGATHVIDSSTEDVKERAKELAASHGRTNGVDVIYDPVGGDLAEACLRALREEGRYAVVGFVAGIPKMPANQVLLRNRSVIGIEYGGWAARFPQENLALVHDLIGEIAAGRLHPVEPTTYPLAEVSDALRGFAERRVVGKIALVP